MTSATSAQTSLFRHEARTIIRKAFNANDNDAVIFIGSGCTAAIHKLIHNLCLCKEPIVLIGPFEHHSNLLPWRHLAHKVIRINSDQFGMLDSDHLRMLLTEWSKVAEEEERVLLVCLNAASNVTGILTDVDKISSMVHSFGAKVFWDYATAAPYIEIEMNPMYVFIFIPNKILSSGSDKPKSCYKDAVFVSVHKFVGGPQTSGLLIAKKELFTAGEQKPDCHGGGTVFFVRRENQLYLKDVEEREEGGTPAIVQNIRTGMVIQLKEALGVSFIMEREFLITKRSWKVFDRLPNIVILGHRLAPRLPIFSFIVRYEMVTGQRLLLHHNFIAALMNDLFGIQARGGCACAGPYAMDLLGISENIAEKLENLLVGCGVDKYFDHPHREIFRPGFCRVSLPYILWDSEVDFILRALEFLSDHAINFLPWYKYDPVTGHWSHREYDMMKQKKWLGHITYASNGMRYRKPIFEESSTPHSLIDLIYQAELKSEELISVIKSSKLRGRREEEELALDPDLKSLRWFMLPSEAEAIVKGVPCSSLDNVTSLIWPNHHTEFNKDLPTIDNSPWLPKNNNCSKNRERFNSGKPKFY